MLIHVPTLGNIFHKLTASADRFKRGPRLYEGGMTTRNIRTLLISRELRFTFFRLSATVRLTSVELTEPHQTSLLSRHCYILNTIYSYPTAYSTLQDLFHRQPTSRICEIGRVVRGAFAKERSNCHFDFGTKYVKEESKHFIFESLA